MKCNEYLSMWEGEYEGNCILPPDHEDSHNDGLYEWTDDPNENPIPL